MFPSLTAQRSGRIVREVVLESEMKFEGIDYRAAAMMVRYGMDLFEIRRLGLKNIVPRSQESPVRRLLVVTETEMRTGGSFPLESQQRLRRGS